MVSTIEFDVYLQNPGFRVKQNPRLSTYLSGGTIVKHLLEIGY